MFTYADASASLSQVDADLPSPAKHPRTSLRGDNAQGNAEVSNGPVESKSKGKAPAKGSVGKSKGKQKGQGRAVGEVEDGKEDGQGIQVERRAARVVAEDSLKYTADTMRCPLPGCDSKGRLLMVNLMLALLSVLCSDTDDENDLLLSTGVFFQLKRGFCATTDFFV